MCSCNYLCTTPSTPYYNRDWPVVLYSPRPLSRIIVVLINNPRNRSHYSIRGAYVSPYHIVRQFCSCFQPDAVGMSCSQDAVTDSVFETRVCQSIGLVIKVACVFIYFGFGLHGTQIFVWIFEGAGRKFYN